MDNIYKKDLCIVIIGATRIDMSLIIDCIENHKKQFEWANPDIWLFTWKTEDDRELQLKEHVYKLIADEESPTYELLDAKGIPFTGQLKQFKPNFDVCRMGHYAVPYSVGRVFEEIDKSGEKYKYACRSRNDLHIEFHSKTWKERVDSNPSLYLTAPCYWAAHCGMNDHFGFGKYQVVRDAWYYDEEHFKKFLGSSWNPEICRERIIADKNIPVETHEVDKYIIRRSGRTDMTNPDLNDSVHKG